MFFSCSSSEELEETFSNDDETEIEEVSEVTLEDQLPQVFFNTNGGTIVDEPRISSDAIIVVGNDTIYNGNMGIEFRGASSQDFPKKSYRLETWDENNEDINVSLFGLP